MAWIDTADGHTCPKHSETFRRGEVCSGCVSDPDEVGVERSSTEIDDEIAALASTFTTRARRLWRECEDLLDEGTAQDKSVAVKLSAESAKWERLALEAKDKISARRHLREAMAHEQAMSSSRGH